MNRHKDRVPFAVFAAVYSGIPLFFAVFARCFSLLFRSGASLKPRKSAAKVGSTAVFFGNNSE